MQSKNSFGGQLTLPGDKCSRRHRGLFALVLRHPFPHHWMTAGSGSRSAPCYRSQPESFYRLSSAGECPIAYFSSHRKARCNSAVPSWSYQRP